MQVSKRWLPHTLAGDQWVRHDFGSLSVMVLSRHEEWRIATHHGDRPDGLASAGTIADLPGDATWERWDRDTQDTKLQFRPVFPDRPVVAWPRSVLNLSPKGKTSFIVGIPAWIEILGECQGEMIPLTAVPTGNLSKTWHGTPLAGRLGYSLRTFARRVYDPEMWPPFEILCSISIVNEGSKALPLDRIFLETDHLSVFEKDNRLWSNAARIRVAAEGADLSNITYASRPSEPNEDAVEVTTPRKGKIRRSTIHNTFVKVLSQFNPMEMDS